MKLMKQKKREKLRCLLLPEKTFFLIFMMSLHAWSFVGFSFYRNGRREVPRCSCGVARKESCTACGRTVFAPCCKAHPQQSISACGERATPMHVRTGCVGVSPLHTLHCRPSLSIKQCKHHTQKLQSNGKTPSNRLQLSNSLITRFRPPNYNI